MELSPASTFMVVQGGPPLSQGALEPAVGSRGAERRRRSLRAAGETSRTGRRGEMAAGGSRAVGPAALPLPLGSQGRSEARTGPIAAVSPGNGPVPAGGGITCGGDGRRRRGAGAVPAAGSGSGKGQGPGDR